MGEVSAYLSTLDGADRDALERVYAIAREVVPEAEEGTSYGMAALLYRGDDRRHLTRLINTGARHDVPLIAIADALYHDPVTATIAIPSKLFGDRLQAGSMAAREDLSGTKDLIDSH